MTQTTAQNCPDCHDPIRWETLAGTRVFRERDGSRIYLSRCGCGTVYRYHDGRSAETRFVVLADLKRDAVALSDHAAILDAYSARNAARKAAHPSAVVRVGSRGSDGSWRFV